MVLRKEWERRLGGGRFLWGVNHLPATSHGTVGQSRGATALFSPHARKHSRAAKAKSSFVYWNAWVDFSGQLRPLPSHALITSTAVLPSGRAREKYFALVCFSPDQLQIGGTLNLRPGEFRHARSGRVLSTGTSTAVVDFHGKNDRVGTRTYPVSLAVSLDAPYFIRLAEPSPLKARELAAVATASRDGDMESYLRLVRRLRGKASDSPSLGMTGDLFDAAPSDNDWTGPEDTEDPVHEPAQREQQVGDPDASQLQLF